MTPAARHRLHLRLVSAAWLLAGVSAPAIAAAPHSPEAARHAPPAVLAPRATPAAQGISILHAWQAAWAHNRTLHAARARHAAAQSNRDMAAALWRPSVALQGTAGVGYNDTAMHGAHVTMPGMGSFAGVDFGSAVHRGHLTQWGVQVQQSLYSPALSAQKAQLQLAALMGDTQWDATVQHTRLQTVEQYIHLVLAQEKQATLHQQHAAVARMAQEATERFRLGDAPITDTHEANAELASMDAQLAAAQADAAIAQQALQHTTGLPAPLTVRPLPTVAPMPQGRLQDWLNAALQHNMQLRQLQQAADLQHQRARAKAPHADWRVQLVAHIGRERLSGYGHWANSHTSSTQRMLGVQLHIPIYTGGMGSAQHRQALHEAQQAQAELDAARNDIQRHVQSLWWTLQAGQTRITALQRAQTALHARLDATRLGRTLGDRSTLDVLRAEAAYAHNQHALLDARSQQLLGQLRLAEITHQLTDTLLRTLSESPTFRLTLSEQTDTEPEQTAPAQTAHGAVAPQPTTPQPAAPEPAAP